MSAQLATIIKGLRSAQLDGKWTSIDDYKKASKAQAKITRANIAKCARMSTKERFEHIAIFDTESDPFDNTQTETVIRPFLGIIYTEQHDPIIIWQDDYELFKKELADAFETLTPNYTIYAHNGGKFDFKFMLGQQRGRIRCKGGAIMEFKFKGHTFRDSLHILPVALARYHKEKFDYEKLRREVRGNHRKEIIDYCLSDCKNAHEIVKEFIVKNGFKMSIGQASLALLKKEYAFDRLPEYADKFMRSFYLGGRTECFANVGEYNGPFELYDVNSMYPFVMSRFEHPIGNISSIGNEINEHTMFIHLRCRNSGALAVRGVDGRIDCSKRFGEFYTTIHEYKTALKFDLISEIEILQTVDFEKRSTFSRFVDPLYARRQIVKKALKDFPDELPLIREDLILKLLLNNAYGKFAQNWKNFREVFVTDVGEYPFGPGADGGDWGLLRKGELVPNDKGDDYWVWKRKPDDGRYYNVATAASITGASRAVLMEAIHLSEKPMYCDTDSLICKSLDKTKLIDPSELGAWKHEKTIETLRLGGKKLYGYTYRLSDKDASKALAENDKALIKLNDKYLKSLTKCKGAVLTWEQLGLIIQGSVVGTISKGPTIGMDGNQVYIKKEIQATGRFGPKKNYPLLGKKF